MGNDIVIKIIWRLQTDKKLQWGDLIINAKNSSSTLQKYEA